MADLERSDVLVAIDAAFPDAPMLLTLGGTVREMIKVAGRKPNQLANLDAMGLTLPIGLGVALGLEGDTEKTLVIEGDGSLLMGLTTVGTVGHLKPANLVLLVLDNGVYLATGGQPTAAADMDFCAVALASGWAGAREVRGAVELGDALGWARDEPGPLLIRVHTGTKQIPTEFFLEDPVVLAAEFRRWLDARRAAE